MSTETGTSPDTGHEANEQNEAAEPYEFDDKTFALLERRFLDDLTYLRRIADGSVDEELLRSQAAMSAVSILDQDPAALQAAASHLVARANPGVDWEDLRDERQAAREDFHAFGVQTDEVKEATIDALREEFSALPEGWEAQRRREATTRMEKIRQAAPWVKAAANFVLSTSELDDLLEDYSFVPDDEKEAWIRDAVEHKVGSVGGNMTDEELLQARAEYLEDLKTIISHKEEIINPHKPTGGLLDEYQRAQDILDHLPPEPDAWRERLVAKLRDLSIAEGVKAVAINLPLGLYVMTKMALGNLVERGLEYVNDLRDKSGEPLSDREKTVQRARMAGAVTLGIVAITVLERTGALSFLGETIGDLTDSLNSDSDSTPATASVPVGNSGGVETTPAPSHTGTPPQFGPEVPNPTGSPEPSKASGLPSFTSPFDPGEHSPPPAESAHVPPPPENTDHFATARSSSVEGEAEKILKDLKAEGQIDTLDSAKREAVEEVLKAHNPNGFEKGATIDLSGIDEVTDRLAGEESGAAQLVGADTVLYEAQRGDSVDKIVDRLLEARGIDNPDPELRSAVEQAVLDNNYTYNGSAHWIDQGQVMHLDAAQDVISDHLSPPDLDTGNVPAGLDNSETSNVTTEQPVVATKQSGGETAGSEAVVAGGSNGLLEGLTEPGEAMASARPGEDVAVLFREAGIPRDINDSFTKEAIQALVTMGVAHQLPTFPDRYYITKAVPKTALAKLRAIARKVTSRK